MGQINNACCDKEQRKEFYDEANTDIQSLLIRQENVKRMAAQNKKDLLKATHFGMGRSGKKSKKTSNKTSAQ